MATDIMMNCPMCKGAGKMPMTVLGAGQVMCKACDGTGRVPVGTSY